MKTRIITFLIVSFCITVLYAHNVNYNNAILRHWSIVKENKTIEGTFYLYKNGNVVIEDADSKLFTYPLSSLSSEDQAFALQKYQWVKDVNNKLRTRKAEKVENLSPFNFNLLIAVVILILLGSYIWFVADRKKLRYLLPIVSVGVISVLVGFTNNVIHLLQSTTDPAFIDSAFAPFKPKVATHWDQTYFYVESHGIPDHQMMAGITNWQQQVPIAQCYIGNNAWSIPLNPVIAASPVPVNPNHFLRGAIAVAVNGVVIFNPYTNTGVDALVDGQLDEFGGHCGRADDYHYHVAPLSLYSQTSATLPIAFALDGFAVYGALEPDGSPMKTLDTNHGHFGSNGVYHYHGTVAKPYMIGNMVGKVTEDTTLQIVPQAHANPVRPAQNPLKGATIISCVPNGSNNGYVLTYTLGGQNYSVDYNWTVGGVYTFNFISPTGTTTQTYNGFIPCESPSSVEEISSVISNVLLFPNPANGKLHLQLSNSLSERDVREITITRSFGDVILKLNRFHSDIDISHLSSGAYFVTIQLPTIRLTKKLIIE